MLDRMNKTSFSHQGKPEDSGKQTVCWSDPGVGLRAGMPCPRCKKAKIEYDGLLQLVCPNCGLTEAGANT